MMRDFSRSIIFTQLPSIIRISALFILGVLAGCASSLREPSDAGPTRQIDVSAIPEVIARPVTRTKAGNYSPYTVLGKTYAVLEDSRGYRAEGLASWYGSKFHGRHTSNGEIFDMYGLTAAHKHLPIPTYAEVTNLNNGRSIVVRINDRGPFHSDRIIDLSWAAAAKLGFANMGTAPVRVVTIDPDSGATPVQLAPVKKVLPAPSQAATPAPMLLPARSYYQVASLTDRFRASQYAQDIEALTKYPVAIDWDDAASAPVYKVLVGPLKDRREVSELSTLLKSNGVNTGFLMQLDRSQSVMDIDTR